MTLFFLAHFAFAVASIVLACTFGCRLSRRLHCDDRAERFVVATTVGLGALGLLLLLLGLLGWLRPLPVAAALSLALVVSLPAARLLRAERGGPVRRDRSIWIATALVLGPSLLVLSLMPLYPPTAFDAGMYHLPYAKAFAATGSVPLLPEVRYPIYPQLQELLFTAALLLGSDIDAQFLHALAAALTAGLLLVWGRSASAPAAGLLAAAIWLGTPVVLWLGGSAYNDLGLALFATAAAFGLDRWRRSAEREWLTLAAFAAGCAAAIKYPGLVVVGGLVVLAALDGRGARLRSALWAGGVAGLTLAPWYLRIYFLTGTPLFPYLRPDPGGAARRQPVAATIIDLVDKRGGLLEALTYWTELPRRLMRVGTVNPGLEWGPVYSLGLILVAWVAWREAWARRPAALLVAWSLAYALFAPRDSRLLLPVAPLWALLIATGCWRLVAKLPSRTGLRPALIVLLAVLVVIPGLSNGASELGRRGRPPVDPAGREAYLTRHLPGYSAVAYLNRHFGSDWKAFGVHAEALAYHADGTLLGDWWGDTAYQKLFRAMANAEQLRALLREWDVDYLFFTRLIALSDDTPAFSCRFERLLSQGGTRLYRLLDATRCSDGSAAPELNESPVLRSVMDWGPRATRVGRPFNAQADGTSALWFIAPGEEVVSVELMGTILPTLTDADGLTVSVPLELQRQLTAKPGVLPVVLVSADGKRRQSIGVFRVLE